MRRLTAWIGGVAGGVAAYRLWRRHSQAASAPYPEPASPEPTPTETDDRADELRAKLAESRTAEPESEAAPAEPAPEEESAPEEEPAAEAESPEERRRAVHEEGRAAVDDMQSENSGQ